MTDSIDVRFENGEPVNARVHLTIGEVPITVTYSFSNGDATRTGLDAPTEKIGKSLNLQQLNALINALNQAETDISNLSFVTSIVNN